jgi:GTP-binding protein
MNKPPKKPPRPKTAGVPPKKKAGDSKHLTAEFIISAAYCHQLPPPGGPEYCVMGRSNVGKSSFINHALSDHRLAKVSRTPGKTTLANVFRLSNGITWVDLPGYGYAHASRTEKVRWSQLIQEYCSTRKSLAGIIWLLDIRHPGMQADQEAFVWLSSLNLPIFPVFTKYDKVTQLVARANIKAYIELFCFPMECVCYSINHHASRQGFWRAFSAWHAANIKAGNNRLHE